ncbi:hypothetical protein GH714_028002 [Hevea brasiliensis]|uniref:C2 domain-containing protein n=1 Tax=Hevea brasiliensis TaxID=3981 RepID=A0A6A6MMX3_HEVBR|nr:hypothetical protein GH714_028002 [Hevea brasiliensis]
MKTILSSSATTCDFSLILFPQLCPSKNSSHTYPSIPFSKRRRKKLHPKFSHLMFSVSACIIPTNGSNNRNANSIRLATRIRNILLKQIANESETQEDISLEESSSLSSSIQMGSNFTGFQEDPMLDKLRTQLGVIHPIPSPPINRNIVGLFVFFFFVGVVFDKLWTSRKTAKMVSGGGQRGPWPQVPTSFSLFLEKDLQRKESVEWVNMVLGKLWKVYNLVSNRPTIYWGARMLLMLSLKFVIIPIAVPVGVRDFDIDGELWVKVRLIPTEPWVGAVSWAFVSLPKIKFELSPFRLFNLMAIPVLSMFLTKLLTEDLPRLFVRPKKIVLDFQNGKAVGPVANDFRTGEMQEGNNDFVGELSVTLVDARKLSFVFYGKTDPYVILRLGDQTIRSKKNSQTTVIGPPGQPIWNQETKLYIEVKDSLGFTDLAIGNGEVDLGSLQDTVPTNRIVVLRGGWGLFRKGSYGEILLRLTYKAYVEDEDDEKTAVESTDTDDSDDELSDSEESNTTFKSTRRDSYSESDKESFMDVLAALIVSEEFQGIVASETGSNKILDDISSAASRGLNAESIPSDPYNSSESSGGSVIVWLAVFTSTLVLIAVNMGGSSFFNP